MDRIPRNIAFPSYLSLFNFILLCHVLYDGKVAGETKGPGSFQKRFFLNLQKKSWWQKVIAKTVRVGACRAELRSQVMKADGFRPCSAKHFYHCGDKTNGIFLLVIITKHGSAKIKFFLNNIYLFCVYMRTLQLQ